MDLISSAHSQLLKKAMDSYTLRQRVTSSNIANINTPEYSRQRVDFEQSLREARDSGNMEDVTTSITQTDEKVNLEDELLEMADTQMRVELVSRSLRHHYDMLKTGITSMVR